MFVRHRWFVFFAPLCLLGLMGFAIFAQQRNSQGQYPASLLAGLQWRDVGPTCAAARTFAVAGHAQPARHLFYFGSAGSGVWKTENAGHTWNPIARQRDSDRSIGAIAVAPSNPNVIYVGTVFLC